jgi:arsenical pump membrane protein
VIPLHATAVYLIATGAIACVLARPRGWPEAVWAVAGAAVLVCTGLLGWRDALRGAGKAGDVCLFLSGMMLLAELARREGVFDWCAALAMKGARGSPVRLFWLIYAVGVAVTVFLSNDATAVVMTPAVLAAARAARVRNTLPYLLACALVANAASFVLPISNPANLVLFAGKMPALGEWLALFALPSLLSIVATGAALYAVTRGEMAGDALCDAGTPRLSGTGRLVLWGIGLSAAGLLAASALGRPLGPPTLAMAVVALGLAGIRDRRALWEVPRGVPWSVLPLVAGLFIVVEAVENAGGLAACTGALEALARLPVWQGSMAGAGAITLLSNVVNNLPSGLLAGNALAHSPVPPALRDALLIGVDLGPNLSVTGSLATLLWLIVLRREGEHVSAWSFLKIGALVMPAALLPAVLASVLQQVR